MHRILEDLNPPQAEAVTHLDGPMLVVAGAGSGKTRVVTRRIAWLIDQGVPDRNILALTFTNKAAGEMAERVGDLVGHCRAWVSTFHSACARFLRFDIDRWDCGRDSSFSIYDDGDQDAIIKTCLDEANLDAKRWSPRGIRDAISRWKCDMTTPEDAAAAAKGPKEDVAADMYERYEDALRRANAFDFDDLLWTVYRMWEAAPEILAEYRERFRYVLVDEYQDTNHMQYRMLRLLADEHRNLHATGDPDQSIYSWRGADYTNIMAFQEDYPGARIVPLEQNYRSTKRILDAANHLIRHNTDRIEKDLFCDGDDGDAPRVVAVPDDRCEASFLASEIDMLSKNGAPLREAAVFYRTNAQSRPVEEVFMREKIPYVIVGGVRFYDRKEIKDTLAYLKAVNNPRDAIAFRRMVAVPPKGVGVKTLDTIEQAAAAAGQGMLEYLLREDFDTVYPGRLTAKLKALCGLCAELRALPRAPVRELLETVLDRSGLKEHVKDQDDDRTEDRLQNIEALVNRAAEFDEEHPDGDLAAFLEDVALVADVDEWDPSQDRVTLMTMHAAKGLEFDNVFVIGLEEGLLPHKNSLEKESALEEERRLFYVAITRTRKRLCITHAAQRLQWGQIAVLPPSCFLDELPENGVTEEGWDGGFSMPSPDLMPNMAPRGYYSGKRGPAPQGRRRKFGMGQPRRRTFDDDLDDVFDDDEDAEAFDPFGDDETNGPVIGGRTKPSTPPESPKPRSRPKKSSGSNAYRTGERVVHPTFGTGTILAASGKKLVVNFPGVGTKNLHAGVARLRKA